MSFKEVSESLNRLVKTVGEIYRGYHQFTMVKTIFCGLLIGEPVLLIGSHGSMKTSMASFIGKLFDKPVVTVKGQAKNRAQLEKFFEDIGGKIGLPPEGIMRNLVDGISCEYEQVGETVEVTLEIDIIKHPKAKVFGKPKRKPLEVFSMQVTDQMDPEDVLGYGLDHPAILGKKPPHVIKKGKIAGADYVVLDEIFAAPRFLSKLHHALNEKKIDTTVGAVDAKPLTWVLCTNPFNSYYATNLAVTNVATLDRYALSARSLPPSIQEILVMVKKWQKLKLQQRVPVEIIYAGRKLLETIKIPDEYMIFCLGLIAHLSKCYFATSTSQRSEVAKDPFETEKDCSLCIFNTYPCGIANVGKVRSIIRLQQTMKAHALLNMRQEVQEEDLSFALLSVLPHRLSWNSEAFLAKHGDIFTATKALIQKYAEYFVDLYPQIKLVEQLITRRDPALALELKRKYFDQPIVRSILDELTDMLKESALKKGAKKQLELLEPKLAISKAIKLIREGE